MDWIAIATSDQNIMILRIPRLFKVFRALKVIAMFDKLMSHRLGADSKGVVLVQVGCFTLVFAHLMCCLWYAIGLSAAPTDTQRHWIDDFIVDDSNIIYLYFVAYHWVLAQITLGSNDINPTSSYERAFAIALNVFGLLYSSTI